MKGPARKASVLVGGFVVLLIAGCGQQEPPSVKQSRAIAAENIELRKQVARLNREIEKLKEQHEKEIKKQEKLLTQCDQDKEAWKKKAQQNIRSQVAPVLDAVMDETAKLREENTRLKAQIEQLQKEAAQNKDANR
jgi:septal ring factor EnvC (AmiA/AmiB activator)